MTVDPSAVDIDVLFASGEQEVTVDGRVMMVRLASSVVRYYSGEGFNDGFGLKYVPRISAVGGGKPVDVSVHMAPDRKATHTTRINQHAAQYLAQGKRMVIAGLVMPSGGESVDGRTDPLLREGGETTPNPNEVDGGVEIDDTSTTTTQT